MRRAWRALLALHGTFAAQIALVAVWLGPKPLPRYARATCASLQFNTDATLVLVVDDKAIVPRECLDHARVWEVGADGVAKGLGEAAARALRRTRRRRKRRGRKLWARCAECPPWSSSSSRCGSTPGASA